MSTDPLSEPELEVLNDTASQFHLIHLIGAITALAVLSAIFAPTLRALRSEHATLALTLAGIQLAVMTGAFFMGSYRRRTVLHGSGARLGQSFAGSPICQLLISTFIFGAMLLACVGIALLALRESSRFAREFPLILVYINFLITLFSVPLLLHIRWKRHLGVLEFFEHGVALTPISFTPWELIDVQPQEPHKNGIRLIVTTQGKYTPNLNIAALVSPELRSYLLKHYSSADYRPPLKKRTLFDR